MPDRFKIEKIIDYPKTFKKKMLSWSFFKVYAFISIIFKIVFKFFEFYSTFRRIQTENYILIPSQNRFSEMILVHFKFISFLWNPIVFQCQISLSYHYFFIIMENQKKGSNSIKN